jgi:exodeoxyribonuclease VII small subunit
MAKKTSDSEKLSYEQAFEELDKVVSALENEQPTLDEAMALFERGQELMKRCAQLLEEAELKVRKLTQDELNQD